MKTKSITGSPEQKNDRDVFMCGIAGFNFNDKELITRMTNSIRHRGPDDSGCMLDTNVSLGHRRLSVIDTSEKGHQPMSFQHLEIVFNGEIYNFKELKQQLESEGYGFTSATDTEVVLCSYHKWGGRCVEKFNGMWSFCIYDKNKKSLFLSRDRFGIKPLYYYFDGKKFIFASELKAIRQHSLDLKINTTAMNMFFNQKYIGADLTIFENCHKLKPAENLTFDLGNNTLTKTTYYDLDKQIAESSKLPLNDRLQTVESIIAEAVEDRLIADVPVGSFLSGGVDSSLISAIIARGKKDFDTFSIGFKEQSYDEVNFSKIVSSHIKTDHHVDYLDIDDKLIEHVISNMDEPFGDVSVLPTYLLSKIARKRVTVSLSGDAGDEVFGGYDTHKAYMLARFLPAAIVRAFKPIANMLPVSQKKLPLTFKIKKFINDFDADINQRHLNWMSTFNSSARKDLLGTNFADVNDLMNISDRKGLLSVQLNDIHNYLAEDILKKVDLASMLNSLEVRVPFLDHRLVPLVLSLPEKYRIRFMKTKYLLKQIASDYLPRQIVNRKKRGFTVPVSKWIKNSELVKEFLTNRCYYQSQLLDYDHVQRLLADHISGRCDNARQLWLVFVFNYWHNSLERN